MNIVHLSGNIVGNTATNEKLYVYRQATDNKKSVVNFFLSVQRPYAKKDENGYYPSDLIPMTAFGSNADFINKYFIPGSAIIVEGRVAIDPGQEKEDGTRYPSRLYILVDNQEFPPQNRGKAKDENGMRQVKSTAKPVTPKASSFMPF